MNIFNNVDILISKTVPFSRLFEIYEVLKEIIVILSQFF